MFGDGFAGRPIRGLEKEFGKKVLTQDPKYNAGLNPG
jgi:hypothetical protein